MNDKIGIVGLGSVLNALAAGEAPAELRLPAPPPPSEPRSGGRRETRQQIHAGNRLIFRSEGMQHGKTAPIKRAVPKRPAGMTAKEWKRARRASREAVDAKALPTEG